MSSAPGSGIAPGSGGRSIRALVVDYAGVLTVPIRAAFEAWLAADQIAPETFEALLAELRTEPDNPMHQIETGAISADDFADFLVSRLRRADGGAVPAAGLNQRIFAGLDVDPEAFVLLRAARAAGLRTALLSNSWDFAYPWDQLDPLLDAKIVSGEVGLRKPDPAIYHLAGAELGVPLAECVFVDDLLWNVEAAAAVGMHAVLHTDLASTLAALVDLVPELAAYLPAAGSDPAGPGAHPDSDNALDRGDRRA